MARGGDGTVYIELNNFEHDGCEFIGDSGQGATSIEFSLDNGKSWARRDPVTDFYNQTERGIYDILSWQGESFIFIKTGSTSTDGFRETLYAPGEEVSITFRIPQSDTYKASEWSAAINYTLKDISVDVNQVFAEHYGFFLSDKSYYNGLSQNYFESNGYVVYKEDNLIKFGKIMSSASETESGMYDYVFVPLEELSEAEGEEITKFEYKFLSKLEYVQNVTTESVNLLDSITPDIQTYENNLLISSSWEKVPASGIVFDSTDSNLLWKYDYEIPNATTQGVDIETHTSFILLVRIASTDTTANSNVVIFEYTLSRELVE